MRRRTGRQTRGRREELSFTRDDIEALLEAIVKAELFKPMQVAKREVFRKWGILGTRKDHIFTAIVYKLYALRGTIDRIASKLTGIPLEEFDEDAEMDPWLRAALRLAVYLRLFDAVKDPRLLRAFEEHAPQLLRERISSEAERVLRELWSKLEGFEWRPESPDEELEYKYRVSAWLISRIRRILGNETEEFLKAINEQPWLGFRVNTLKASVEDVLEELRKLGLKVRVSPYVPTVIKYKGTVNYDQLHLLKEGKIIPQDDSSALAAIILDPKPGERIIDLTAAPGGKTIHLAELSRVQAEIVALDVFHDRMLRLVEMAKRTGTAAAIHPVLMDARMAPNAFGEEVFDKALVDPSCSSTGVLGKHPDARWRLNEKRLCQLVSQQEEILEAAIRLVKPGGRILYTVCSILPEEGEEIIKKVLNKYSNCLRLVPLQGPFDPSPLLPGTMRAWPHRHGTSGFFYALLEKTRSLKECKD
ncbi:RsmB/NOP family class I SAM-dependent RNA methyltransferase [Pyrolobus fumarii]|nr:RsmB/NOP family class I SAM-dependent RNA methyltransferase [Pyrolobus fumarii]